MDSVFNVIFRMFSVVIDALKTIPVWNNVSLFDFSIAILIMSIVIVAFVNVVPVGSTNYVNDTLKAEREADRQAQREVARAERLEENRRYNLMSKTEKRNYLNRN